MSTSATATKHARACLEFRCTSDRIEYAKASRWGSTDLFGVFDAIAITNEVKPELLQIQWTGGASSDASVRRKKVGEWVKGGTCIPGACIEVWQWIEGEHFRRWRWFLRRSLVHPVAGWVKIEPLTSPLLVPERKSD